MRVGGGGGNRLVSRGSRCIARPLGQRQALLAETLASPRVDAGSDLRKPPIKNHRKGGLLLVETAGIEPASRSPLQTVLHA